MGKRCRGQYFTPRRRVEGRKPFGRLKRREFVALLGGAADCVGPRQCAPSRRGSCRARSTLASRDRDAIESDAQSGRRAFHCAHTRFYASNERPTDNYEGVGHATEFGPGLPNPELRELRPQASGPAGVAPATIGEVEPQIACVASVTGTSGNLFRTTSGNGGSLACIVIE